MLLEKLVNCDEIIQIEYIYEINIVMVYEVKLLLTGDSSFEKEQLEEERTILLY